MWIVNSWLWPLVVVLRAHVMVLLESGRFGSYAMWRQVPPPVTWSTLASYFSPTRLRLRLRCTTSHWALSAGVERLRGLWNVCLRGARNPAGGEGVVTMPLSRTELWRPAYKNTCNYEKQVNTSPCTTSSARSSSNISGRNPPLSCGGQRRKRYYQFLG